jgi:hypothetical protein
MPNRDTWQLIDTVTAKAAINPAIEAEEFRTAAAIRFLQKLKRERSREERGGLQRWSTSLGWSSAARRIHPLRFFARM